MKKLKRSWWDYLLQVVTVFLGVTAGFVLNNWEKERENRKLERQFLTSFYNELESDQEALIAEIQKDSLWLADSKHLLKERAHKRFPNDSTFAVYNRFRNISMLYLPNNSFQNLVNSGNLGIIRNFELSNLLSQYSNMKEGLSVLDNHFLDFYNKYVTDFQIREVDIVTDRFIHPEVAQGSYFFNIFSGYFSLLNNRYHYYKDLLKRSQEVQSVLKKELKKEKEDAV